MEDSLDATKDFISQLSPLHIGAIVLAVVLVAIGLRLILRKPPSHLNAFDGNAGRVLVSRKALQELIKQTCRLNEWVEAARPVVRLRHDKVTARVELRLSSAENLKLVCEGIQEQITSLLQRSLSFEQIGDIEIVVKSFGSDIEERPPALPPHETPTPQDETPPSSQR